jgi:hypothetical protein
MSMNEFCYWFPLDFCQSGLYFGLSESASANLGSCLTAYYFLLPIQWDVNFKGI